MVGKGPIAGKPGFAGGLEIKGPKYIWNGVAEYFETNNKSRSKAYPLLQIPSFPRVFSGFSQTIPQKQVGIWSKGAVCSALSSAPRSPPWGQSCRRPRPTWSQADRPPGGSGHETEATCLGFQQIPRPPVGLHLFSFYVLECFFFFFF